jgi:glycolate oxidase FAD binding subunit
MTPAGTVPIVEPETAEDLAASLRRASDTPQSVLIRGAETKIGWCRPPQRIDVVLSTRRLNRVLAHEHGDLTATVEAGATLRDVNAALAAHGQWLPLDPPFADRATIGGVLATNDSGPLRHRFGTPRDLVIGVRLATTDGVLSKAGGQVVKNVAGYDVSKLVSGSFGSLAAIVSATFKLSPLPAASKTIVVEAPDAGALSAIVRAMMGSQLEPMAFEVAAQRSTQSVLLRFASLPAVVDAQIEQTSALVKGCATRILAGGDEHALWREHATRMWDAPGAVVRASWLPASIAEVLGGIDAIRAGMPTPVTGRPTAIDLIARAAVGAGLMRIDGDARAQAAAIEQLRESPAFRNIVIVRGSDELKSLVDVWGPQGDRERLFVSLKRAFDPTGVLNAGRGPL